MKEGWALKTVKDVSSVIAGQSPEGRYYNADKVGLPFYQGKKEFGEKYIKSSGVWTSIITKTAIAGDILMSVRAPVGPVNVSTEEICIGRGLAAIRQKDNVIHDFLFYFFKYYEGNIKGNIGAVFDSINKAQIENIPFLIPPLPEQQRIVSIIDEAFEAIDKAIENTQKNLQNAKELYHGYIKGVFETFDNDWEIKTLGDIGKPSMCKRILKHQTLGVGDIPFYKIGTFGKTPDAFIPKNIYNEFRTKYSFPKKGDILISASGTIGRRVRYDDEPAYFQDSNIVWIANNEKQVLNDYLYVFYEFCDWKPSKGATISRLYNSDLTSIKIRFPKSLDDQKELIGKINLVLTETQTIESKYQAKLLDLEELKKSILNKAFAGEL